MKNIPLEIKPRRSRRGTGREVVGIVEYIREEVAFVEVTYARLLRCCIFNDGGAKIIVAIFRSLMYRYMHPGIRASRQRITTGV